MKKIIGILGIVVLAIVLFLNVSTIVENNPNLDLATLTSLTTANAEDGDSDVGNWKSAYIYCSPRVEQETYTLTVSVNDVWNTRADLSNRGHRILREVISPLTYTVTIYVEHDVLAQYHKRRCVQGEGDCYFSSFSCFRAS